MASATQTASAALEGIADYAFTSEVGHGTNGRYFLAPAPERLGLDVDQVVVKVLMGQPADALEDLARELKVFASVKSRYLTALYDAGQQGDDCYIAMEYHPLGSLSGPSDVDRLGALRAVRDAARGAHDLHEAGIVHRDIQPSNILLVQGGAKLSDFDTAQVLQPGVTVTASNQVQSAEFIDPAVILGKEASRASDIWSLGASLHRALTGISIWGEIPEDPTLAVRFVLNGQPRLHTNLEAADAEVLKPCLALDAGDRYKTAAELADRIDAVLG